MNITPRMTPRTSLAAGKWRAKHQHVEGVAVVGHCLWHKTVVHRIAANLVRHHAIDRARVGLHVEFPLPKLAKRNLDIPIHRPVLIHRRRVTPDMRRVLTRGVEAFDELCRSVSRKRAWRRAGHLRRDGHGQHQGQEDVAHDSDQSNIRASWSAPITMSDQITFELGDFRATSG